MHVTAHAIARLSDRIGGTAAESIVRRLEALPGSADDVAIQVSRTGNTRIVVIARAGSIETVMLRRFSDQPFTAYALGVDRVERMPA